ncbi:hypothetical protein BX666DRAFT_1866556 [Dichotomocladium elegans]|nr:hypothetical protein BX666DRAFT_1866556 [Dichotomocladium elegans]
MASEEEINNQLMELHKETAKIDRDIQNQLRKLMIPIWNKRRAIVKQIPNFWGRVALGNLTDFHVEYDEKNPDYRKIVAEYIFDDEGEGEVVSKSTIEYHDGKVCSALRENFHIATGH